MKRIKLSKSEKDVMRMLYAGCCYPSTFPRYIFSDCVDKLESKGLAKGAWLEGHDLEDAQLTPRGKAYIALNPALRNPVNWTKLILYPLVIIVVLCLFIKVL